ncbi:hypothetical protein C8R42DRAFT_569465, partial [Lentinula raphanica]
GCKSPFRCFSWANKILRAIPHKCNPNMRQPEDNENKQNEEPSEGIPFDGQVMTRGTLTDAFRIFTSGHTTNTVVDHQPDIEIERENKEIYTDGSCLNNGTDNAKAGAGVFCPTNEELNAAIRLPETVPQMNQSGEILSINTIARTADITANLHINLFGLENKH